ncbi:MAG TPA: YdcF family protein [Gemmatimonadaceae bacterium]|nr:YdcF family protein [Gemmatimonadaceae bacterium]
MLGAIVALLAIGWVATVSAILVVGRRDGAQAADAIVVLGAAQYAGHPSPVLRARLDHALDLWRRGLAPRLILTGGRGEGDTTTEAAAERRYLLSHGVPDSVLFLEDSGRTTTESLRGVALLAGALPGRRVILVSDPFHMLRLSILARRFGLTPYTSPTRTSPISTSRSRWKYVLSESVKVPATLVLVRPRHP